MSVLAQAPVSEVEAHWRAVANPPAYRMLRWPETGLVMVRGRAGGTGTRFNVGEMTVTRCAAFRLHHQGLLELVVPAREMTRVQRAHGNATARVTLRLREGIAMGVYPQGSVLPTQVALARSLGVSKATVANAMDGRRYEPDGRDPLRRRP